MQLEQRLVYGPVWSRRFGWDLGVNLLPMSRKLCTFDCVYCQYGSEPVLRNNRYHFPTVLQIVLEWCERLDSCLAKGLQIRHTTFSGNGEPTMHPHFAKIVPQIFRWRNTHAPEVKLAILSNGYRLHDPTIRETLRYFDEPIIKLDSVIPEKLQQINRPLLPFSVSEFVKNLKKCERLMIQTMFIRHWNDSQTDLERWRKALQEIKPVQVQIYTISRTPALSGLLRLTQRELEQIARETTRLLGLRVNAY